MNMGPSNEEDRTSIIRISDGRVLDSTGECFWRCHPDYLCVLESVLLEFVNGKKHEFCGLDKWAKTDDFNRRWLSYGDAPLEVQTVSLVRVYKQVRDFQWSFGLFKYAGEIDVRAGKMDIKESYSSHKLLYAAQKATRSGEAIEPGSVTETKLF